MVTARSSETQSAVMQLLLAEHPTLLSRDEIQREVGSRAGADEALSHFLKLGLVHELDDYFWATRAMMAAEEASTAHMLYGCRSNVGYDDPLSRNPPSP
jgi:hypothetical protein